MDSFNFQLTFYFQFVDRKLKIALLSLKLNFKHRIGTLSNHDGDGEGNVCLKMTAQYFKLFRDYSDSFNLSNVAELSRG